MLGGLYSVPGTGGRFTRRQPRCGRIRRRSHAFVDRRRVGEPMLRGRDLRLKPRRAPGSLRRLKELPSSTHLDHHQRESTQPRVGEVRLPRHELIQQRIRPPPVAAREQCSHTLHEDRLELLRIPGRTCQLERSLRVRQRELQLAPSQEVSRLSATGIEAGTMSTRRFHIGVAEISEVVFAPGRRLSWHGHPHTCLAVVIAGAVRKRFTRAEEDAVDGTVVEMPAEEPHEDLFGRDGARIVVVESNTEPGTLRCFPDWRATILAHDMSRELARPDAYTPLALEGLVLELTATVARQGEVRHREPRLDAVRAMLAVDLSDPPSLSTIAREVGLHPSHLARLFQAHYGQSIGEYGRRLRLEWAAERLVSSNEELACRPGRC
ncbi:MAG TPA: hypothetical protein DIT48_11175 [Actinobacteria bacterium]|nr:hypothetical protein [Actinomycetota bacterium]